MKSEPTSGAGAAVSIARVRRSVTGAGVILGLGLGGFVDGILFHQILQWHHLLCTSCHPEATAAEVRANNFWDGVFHAFTLALTLVGVWLLWRAMREAPARVPGRVLAGAMLAGWGVFNLVEGVINHQLLGIHHVKPGAHQLAWDLGFLASGALLVALGLALARPRPSEG